MLDDHIDTLKLAGKVALFAGVTVGLSFYLNRE